MAMELFDSIQEARSSASRRADGAGSPYCIVSGRKGGRRMFGVLSAEGFGLPAGAVLEEVVEPATERREVEPPEKISSNGF
jgi:hypothetical protein